MTKKKRATVAEMIAACELKQDTITVGDQFEVTIKEMTGRQRFELAERQNEGRFDSLCWVAMNGLVEPKFELEDLEKLDPGWITQIANGIMRLSGLAPDEAEDAENE